MATTTDQASQPTTSALPSWWRDVKGAMTDAGVGVNVWLPILLAESGGNPIAHNTTPPDDSVGLFQLNRAGGQGVGYSVSQLQSPGLNAEIASRYLAQGQQTCRVKNDGTIQCVAIYSGHPGPVARDDRRIIWIAQLAAAIQPAKSDQEAWSLGLARYKAGAGATAPTDPPPGQTGPSIWTDPIGAISAGVAAGTAGLGSSIASGLITGVKASVLGGFTNPDVYWNVIMGLGGLACVTIGTLGLALGNKTVQTVMSAIPETRPVTAAYQAASSVSQNVTTGADAAFNVAARPAQGQARPNRLARHAGQTAGAAINAADMVDAAAVLA